MGYASTDNRLWWDYTFETTVDYALDFDRDHSVDLIGGYSYQYFTEERFEMANNGFTTDGFKDWNMGAGSALNNTDLPRPSMGSFKQDNKRSEEHTCELQSRCHLVCRPLLEKKGV